jgi:hypothetical protein
MLDSRASSRIVRSEQIARPQPLFKTFSIVQVILAQIPFQTCPFPTMRGAAFHIDISAIRE